MYDLKQAIEKIRKKYFSESENGFILVDDGIIEEDFGWTFYFTTKRQIQAKKHGIQLPGIIGAGPVFFDKKSGETLLGTSAFSLELNRAIFEFRILNKKHLWNIKFDDKSFPKDKAKYIAIVKKNFKVNSKDALDMINSKIELKSENEIIDFHSVSYELSSLGLKNKIEKREIE